MSLKKTMRILWSQSSYRLENLLLNICAIKEQLILNICVYLRESVVLFVIRLLRSQGNELKQNHRRLLPLMFAKYKDSPSTLDQALVMMYMYLLLSLG